jgi:hypothetical protein
VIRKNYVGLRNLITSLPIPDPNPNPILSGQAESESENTGSDLHHWCALIFVLCLMGVPQSFVFILILFFPITNLQHSSLRIIKGAHNACGSVSFTVLIFVYTCLIIYATKNSRVTDNLIFV